MLPPYEPEILTDVDELTALVVTAKVALVAPPDTVTLTGTVATDVSLLESKTRAPPVGAAPPRVTVPCEKLPPVTLVGLRASPDNVTGGGGAGGTTVSVALRVVPPYVPETVAEVVAETELVVTVNVVLEEPAGTVAVAGVVTADELSESVTTAPPDGAAPLRVTVPCDELPPVTVVGLRASDNSVIGGGGDELCTIVSVALRLVPPYVPETVVKVVAETELVVTVNVVLEEPAGMVAVVGVVTADDLSESVTTAPPDGAAPLRVTVPCEEPPPVTVVGLRVRADSVTAGGGGGGDACTTVSVPLALAPP